jgi:hypothetical protein
VVIDPTEQWALDAMMSWPKGWRLDFDDEDTAVEHYSDGVPERLDDHTMPARPRRAPRGSEALVEYDNTQPLRRV